MQNDGRGGRQLEAKQDSMRWLHTQVAAWHPLLPQGPLVALAPRLAAYTQPGGLLGLSGGALLRCCVGRARPAQLLLLLPPPPLLSLDEWHALPLPPQRAAAHLPLGPSPPSPAGILQEQTPAVLEAYSPWFEVRS